MTEEYLWDCTGPVDPQIAALEDALAALRLPGPRRAPVIADDAARARRVRLRTRRPSTLATAVLAAAATGALIWAWVGLRAEPPPTAPVATTDVGDQVERQVAVAVPPLPDPAPVVDDAAAAPVVDPEPSPPAAAATHPDPKPGPRTPPRRSPSSADLREAIKPLLPKARACGRKYGAAEGTVVKVHLSIVGATGRVHDARAAAPHAANALGRCVAAALRDAELQPFEKSKVGVQYPVRVRAGESETADPPPAAPPPKRSTATKPSPTQQDIKDGIAPHKADAKACGNRHGALPGEKVVVKLRIRGEDGLVSNAVATGRHHSTPLGECVAKAFAQAEFPMFEKVSIGVQYPVRM